MTNSSFVVNNYFWNAEKIFLDYVRIYLDICRVVFSCNMINGWCSTSPSLFYPSSSFKSILVCICSQICSEYHFKRIINDLLNFPFKKQNITTVKFILHNSPFRQS